jgi:hypothetical protein
MMTIEDFISENRLRREIIIPVYNFLIARGFQGINNTEKDAYVMRADGTSVLLNRDAIYVFLKFPRLPRSINLYYPQRSDQITTLQLFLNAAAGIVDPHRKADFVRVFGLD